MPPLAVLLGLLVQNGTPAPPATPSETSYPVFVWRNGGPKPDARWAATLRELGFTGTNVEGGEDPDFACSLELDFYVDHLVPREILHRDAHDPVFRDSFEGYLATRSRNRLTRVPSLCDIAVLDQLWTLARARSSRAIARGARFLSITDEPSYTSWLTPLDFDQSPPALALYRQALRQRYGSPERLSAAFGAVYGSFDEVPLWTTDEIRTREWSHGPPWTFTPWDEARRFSDEAFAGALRAALDAARPGPPTPAIPAGFLGGQPPSAFGGYDWGRLLATGLDLLEVYDIGAARDLVRALRPSVKLVDTVHLTTRSAPVSVPYAAARLSWLFARGGRTAIVWDNASLFEGTDAQRPTAAARILGARVAALRAWARELDGAAPVFDSIAIVYSQASLRLGWLLDARRDGTTWPKRLATHEYERSAWLASLEGWFRLLEDLGYTPSAIAVEDLTERLALPGAPRALVLPRVLALSADAADALERYRAGGGTLLFEGRPALFDESLRGGDRAGAFDSVWELGQMPFRGFADENMDPAPKAQRTESGLLLLEPTLTSKSHPAGNQTCFTKPRMHLLNVSVGEYRDARLAPSSRAAAALRALVAPLIAAALGQPPYRVRSDSLPVSIHRERRGGTEYVLVTPNVRRRASLLEGLAGPVDAVLFGDGPPPVSVERFEGASSRTLDLLEESGGFRVHIPFDPFDVVLLRVKPSLPRDPATSRAAEK